MARLAPLLAALVLAACHVGQRVESFKPARHPNGVDVDLEGRDTTLSAELLAVSDTGLLLLGGRSVVFAPYGAIWHASFAQLPQVVEHGAPPDSAQRGHLRLVSRFPQGVSPDRLRSLLAAYRQDSLVRLKP